VFVAEGDTVRFATVETGIIGGIEIEVGGIDEGAEVVVGPFQALRALDDGARIQANRLNPGG